MHPLGPWNVLHKGLVHRAQETVHLFQPHEVSYGTRRRAGYPLGSGSIESAHKFICHVRLKRSGVWWYEANSNQMLALRCAKYNGTFKWVFTRYRQR